MKSRITLTFIAILIFSVLSYAQGPWAKKDWKQWSKDDCKKVLEDSPWSYKWIESTPKTANFATPSQGTGGVGSDSDVAAYYIVQIRSARPVRAAVVRQMLIQNNYDKSEDNVKKNMDAQTQGYLDRSYEDVIVVHVVYGSENADYNRSLAAFWQNHFPEGYIPVDTLFHGSNGQKISPTKIISPKNGAQEFEFVFPRSVDGKPLIEADAKTIGIEFDTPGSNSTGSAAHVAIGTSQNTSVGGVRTSVGGVKGGRVFVEFKVDKMKMDGKLIY